MLISEHENIRRVQNVDRRKRFKTIDVKYASSDHTLINITHSDLLELDVSDLTASDAADRIRQHILRINDKYG